MIQNPVDAYNPSTTVEVVDDFAFVSPDIASSRLLSDQTWLYGRTTGGITYYSTGVAGHYGMISVNTGIAAADFAGICLSAAGLATGIPTNCKTIISFKQLQAAMANYEQRLGWFQNGNLAGETSEGMFFRSQGVGNWFAVTRNGGAETAVDLGIAQDTNWHTLIITTNATGTAVQFWFDGVLKTTITTNLTAGTHSPALKADSTGVTAGGPGFLCDFIFAKFSGLAR